MSSTKILLKISYKHEQHKHIYQLKLKTLPNLTTEDTVIHHKLRKYVMSNQPLKMFKFVKTKIGLPFFKHT